MKPTGVGSGVAIGGEAVGDGEGLAGVAGLAGAAEGEADGVGVALHAATASAATSEAARTNLGIFGSERLVADDIGPHH